MENSEDIERGMEARQPPDAADDRSIIFVSQDVEPPPQEYRAEPRRPRWLVPAVLYGATCVSTFLVGGLEYAVPLMMILTAHELGHFFQALRYRVPASLPYFIPMPFTPVGTMGAVIRMGARMGNRKALFDIAISGPLAGLVLAIAFSVVGLQYSRVGPRVEGRGIWELGEPLIFRLFEYWTFGPLDDAAQTVYRHPVGVAGWVGIFITALNLFPIGQLDGGHILYALLRRRAHVVAVALLLAAVVAVVLLDYKEWLLMVFLLILIGPRHPPTGDDYVELGKARIVLGWLVLLFVVVGFTPTPFVFQR